MFLNNKFNLDFGVTILQTTADLPLLKKQNTDENGFVLINHEIN